MDSPSTDPSEVSHPSINPGSIIAQSDAISLFPTTNQPVLDTTLKEMLLSLRSIIQSDMIPLVQQFKQYISSLGNRVEHMEVKMGDYADTINDLVDAHAAQSEEHHLC